MADRITREVTPFVEVVQGPASQRTRVLLETSAGDVVEEDGRMVLRVAGPRGRPQRILLDPDADLYELTLGSDPDLLRRSFEVHVADPLTGPVPRDLVGTTVVVRDPVVPLTPLDDCYLAVELAPNAVDVPEHAVEVHVLTEAGELPDQWPAADGPPICAVIPLGSPSALEVLPQLLHGMGTGRYPAREVRLRIDPRAFQVRDRRAPFLSEVVEAIASAAGCAVSQLVREMALRQRLLPRGVRRHLLPDPYFITWTFQAHPTRGLVPATDHFPVPRRSSRREILRGTPESEHGRLIEYLSLHEEPAPRVRALADRQLFAVSVHFLPNPDLPLQPNHGGIARWNHDHLVSLS